MGEDETENIQSQNSSSNAEADSGQPLSLKPNLHFNPNDISSPVLTLGNSGFRINVESRCFEQHFAPEGNIEPSPENAMKYSMIYAAAFSEFLDWRKNFDKFDNSPGFKTPKVRNHNVVQGTTNETMFNYRKKLFGDAVTLINTYDSPHGDELRYEINLDTVESDPVVMKRINQLSERCENSNFTIKSRLA